MKSTDFPTNFSGKDSSGMLSVTALSLDFGADALRVLFLTRALPTAEAGAHGASSLL